MPTRRRAAEPPIEVTSQLDGEGEIDPIIQQQVADERAGRRRRDLPEEFLERVISAQEYAFHHQCLDENERCRRRGYVNEWLDSLRVGNHYDDWHRRITTHILAERETPEEEEAREAKRKVANERAEALLRSVLSSKQLKELDRRGYFHVEVESRRFRITRGRSHNIKEVDARGRILRTLCAHPVEQVPNADTMLAQKLWLESKPEDFFKIANVLRPVRKRRNVAGQPVVNTRDVDRLIMDRVAETVRQQEEEARARQEWLAAEEDVRIIEDAARATTTPGVEPVPAPAPETPAAIRAA